MNCKIRFKVLNSVFSFTIFLFTKYSTALPQQKKTKICNSLAPYTVSQCTTYLGLSVYIYSD